MRNSYGAYVFFSKQNEEKNVHFIHYINDLEEVAESNDDEQENYYLWRNLYVS